MLHQATDFLVSCVDLWSLSIHIIIFDLFGKKPHKKQDNVQSSGHYHQINPFRVTQDPAYQIMWVYCNRSEVKSMK